MGGFFEAVARPRPFLGMLLADEVADFHSLVEGPFALARLYVNNAN